MKRPLWIGMLVLGLLAVFAGVRLASSAGSQPGYRNVTVQDLYQAPEPKWILDVREPYEFATVHVPGARLIPLGQLAQRAGEIPRDIPVYVICNSGNRSREASRILVQQGFRNIHNVEGGIKAWMAAGYPVVR